MSVNEDNQTGKLSRRKFLNAVGKGALALAAPAILGIRPARGQQAQPGRFVIAEDRFGRIFPQLPPFAESSSKLEAALLEKTGQLLLAGDPESINERGQVWHARWIADGRRHYWDFFDLRTQISDRETLYASPGIEPGSFCQILNDDGTYLPLWRSDLYRVFRGEDIDGGSPPAADDGEELLMVVS